MRAWILPFLTALLALGASPTHAMTAEHERVLVYMEAEEAAAAELFAAFDEVYDCPPLTRIASEERRHVYLLSKLLDTERVDRAADIANYPGLEQDYWRWLAEGYRNLRSAAQVGIAVERRHVALLTAAIAAPIEPNVRRTLQRLRRQDRHHLATFVRVLQETPSVQPCATGRC